MAQIKVLLAATAVAAAATFTARAGHAQQLRDPIGEKGQLIVSADRLVPLFSWSRVAQDTLGGIPAGASSQFTTQTQTSFSLFWGSGFTPQQPGELFFAVPRVGFDYVVIPRLTIGTDLAFFFTVGSSTSTETDLQNGGTLNTSGGNGNTYVFGVAPRVGYLFRINDLLTFWPRGGLSFYTATTVSPPNAANATTHNNVNQLALDLEPQLVITPVSHFGFTVAIDGDIPLYGRHAVTTFNGNGGSTSVAANSSVGFFGVTLGMLGYL
jgi:hypothetical protein